MASTVKENQIPAFKKWFIRLTGIFVFFIIIYKSDLGKIHALLGDIKVWPLLFVTVFVIPHIGLKAYRWYYIIHNLILKKTGFLWAVREYFISLFWGVFSPGRIGEFVKAHSLKKKVNSQSIDLPLFSVIFDRLSDLYFLFLVSVLSGCYFFNSYQLILIIITVIFLSIFLFPQGIKLIWKIIGRRKVDNSNELSISYNYVLKLFFKTQTLTVFSYLFFFIQQLLIARACSLDLNPLFIFCASCAASLAAVIPVTISGVGVRDAVLILFFSHVSVPRESAIVFSIFFLVSINLSSSLLGLISLFLPEP